MDYLEVFINCLEGNLDASKASELIRQQADTLLLAGKTKEYEKAILCLTFFIRYRQYNTGKISGNDLVLFLRDFVLFVGRVRFPRLIQDAVHRDGNKFNADAVAAGFAEDDGTEQLGFMIDFDTSGTEMCSLRHANMRFATFLGIMNDASFARICSAHE